MKKEREKEKKSGREKRKTHRKTEGHRGLGLVKQTERHTHTILIIPQGPEIHQAEPTESNNKTK